jgi:hypothetical protein
LVGDEPITRASFRRLCPGISISPINASRRFVTSGFMATRIAVRSSPCSVYLISRSGRNNSSALERNDAIRRVRDPRSHCPTVPLSSGLCR